MIKMRKILLEEYTNRLLRALSEVDVVDKDGNVIISKDLKVKHIESGYEYTVDDVVTGEDGIQVVLRDPEEPRFEPDGEEGMINDIALPSDHPRLSSDLNKDSSYLPPEQDSEDDSSDLYIIDKEEFEKDYEID